MSAKVQTMEGNKMENGADVLVKSLKDLGVKRIFGYTGGAILPVFEALDKHGIEIIINSNEQAAAFSAAGHSRSSDEIGIVIVTSGPSITNTLTAVCDAYCDSFPLIAIAGQVPEHKIGTDAFQHIDVSSIFKDASKKAIQFSNGTNIEEAIKDLYSFAMSGKKGPIVIDFPLDKQMKEEKYEGLSISRFQKKYENENHLSEKQCSEFFQLLKESKRPLLYIGGGLNSIEGSKAIREFNEIMKIPSVNTLMAKGVVDENDSLSLGMLGMFGTPSANFSVQENDFFFAIGVRWDDRVAEKVGSFGPKSKIAYIDINSEKVEQIRHERNPAFSFIGDAGLILTDLTDYAAKHNVGLEINNWRERIIELKRKWPLDFNRGSEMIQQAEVLEKLNQFIDEDTIITTGVGNHQILAAQYLKMKKPKSFLTSGSFGTMGFGLPTAIGAYFANQNKKIIDVDGDGSLSMNIGELRTVGMYDLPVKIIVLNNLGDGMVRNLQDVAYGGKYIGTFRKKDISIAKIANECNFKYSKRISERKNLEKELNELIGTDGPALLEIMTDIDEAVYPKIPPGKTYKEMILGPYMRER